MKHYLKWKGYYVFSSVAYVEPYGLQFVSIPFSKLEKIVKKELEKIVKKELEEIVKKDKEINKGE